MEVESPRVKLLNQVAHVSRWASNASSFAARSVDMLLDVFSTLLAKSTEGCKKDCPVWEAIMRKDASLDYELASKIMTQTMGDVIDTYHMIFNTLSCMVVCATMLEVSPRLHARKNTASVVAMSNVAMVRASHVSMMESGINLIFAHGRDFAGPKKKAQAFIDTHKTLKTADVPEIFRRELDLITKGSVGVALPSVKADTTSTPQERRPSASPERSAKSDESRIRERTANASMASWRMRSSTSIIRP